jgi:glycosyltransferase involved in cell wall biosynthesis
MKAKDKPRIINIMPHEPAYHFSPDKKPDLFWEKPDGGFLGFWTREWPDLLGEEVLKQSDKYDWEVWQPDYRTDKVYSKKIETGVTHHLFPAEKKSYKTGIKSKNGFFSEKMISRLNNLKNDPMILTFHATYGLYVPFFKKILELFGPGKNFPVFLLGHGMFKSPLSEMLGLHRPLNYLDIIIEHLCQKKLLKHIDVISEQAESALREVKRIYNGRTEKLTMGCDFDYWIPVPSPDIKMSIRQRLNIPQDKMVFLITGNFQPRKQSAKLLEIFGRIADRDDFFLNITGHGDETNTKLIDSLAAPLLQQNKALLHSYVSVEELRNIYWASDIYISVATDEGGPVSVMKAMACGLPVLSTPVGETVERMKQFGAGKFIPVKNYYEWRTVILEILDKELPNTLDREIAKEAYDWPNVAKRFIHVFDDLIFQYYGIRH